MNRLWRLLTSGRLTLVLLFVLVDLMLLGLVVPQRDVVGVEEFVAAVRRSPMAEFILVDLRFGRIATSPIFLATWALFFVNLAAVIVDRMGPMLRQLRRGPPTSSSVPGFLEKHEARTVVRAACVEPDLAVEPLRQMGYAVRPVGDSVLWAVKNRAAPLGFLLFHGSFFLLAAGALWLYYTRFSGLVVLAEGQGFAGDFSQVIRAAPFGQPTPLEFTLESVEPEVDRGMVTQIRASIRLPNEPAPRVASVNHPVEHGDVSLLVYQAGLAPVFWLQDARGYTLDRLTVLATSDQGALPVVPLLDGRIELRVTPVAPGPGFPARAQLASFPMTLSARLDGETRFSGSLAPGERAELGPVTLVLEQVRYWAGLRYISERGGLLLIVGFLVAVLGLIWRMVWYRRELVIEWRSDQVVLGAQCEYFGGLPKEELDLLCELLEKPVAARLEQ